MKGENKVRKLPATNLRTLFSHSPLKIQQTHLNVYHLHRLFFSLCFSPKRFAVVLQVVLFRQIPTGFLQNSGFLANPVI